MEVQAKSDSFEMYRQYETDQASNSDYLYNYGLILGQNNRHLHDQVLELTNLVYKVWFPVWP